MSKYKIGDRVGCPYGSGASGRIVDIKRRFFLPYYVIQDDTYQWLTIFYRYFGWNIWKMPEDNERKR